MKLKFGFISVSVCWHCLKSSLDCPVSLFVSAWLCLNVHFHQQPTETDTVTVQQVHVSQPTSSKHQEQRPLAASRTCWEKKVLKTPASPMTRMTCGSFSGWNMTATGKIYIWKIYIRPKDRIWQSQLSLGLSQKTRLDFNCLFCFGMFSLVFSFLGRQHRWIKPKSNLKYIYTIIHTHMFNSCYIALYLFI